MNGLQTVVAWAAIVGSIVAVASVIIGQIQSSRTRHEAHAAAVQAAYDRGRASRGEELTELRSDRDYWRSKWIDHLNGGMDG